MSGTLDVMARLTQAIEFAQNSPEPKVWGPGDVTYSPRLTIEGDLFDAVAALVRTPEALDVERYELTVLRGLHQRDRDSAGDEWCSVDRVLWPCPTAEVLFAREPRDRWGRTAAMVELQVLMDEGDDD